MNSTRGIDNRCRASVGGKARTHKHAPDMNIDRHVAAVHLSKWNAKLSLQDLNGHGGLLLPYTLELPQAADQFLRGWLVGPQILRSPAPKGDDARCCREDLTSTRCWIPIRHWLAVHCPGKGFCASNDSLRVQLSQTVADDSRSVEGALGRHHLVEKDGDEECESVGAKQSIGFAARGEPRWLAALGGGELKQCRNNIGFVIETEWPFDDLDARDPPFCACGHPR